jgi:hypothetical protein
MVLRLLKSCLLLAWMTHAAWCQQLDGAELADAADRAAEQEDRERNFASQMSGAVLIGHFTDSSRPQPAALHKEQYVLESVRKLDSGQWLFQARIQYGTHDLTLPLTLPIAWAGDTPVIMVDELPIPGLGTFSARVLIHDGYYAGYWRAADHGGHLFGCIERIDKKQAPPDVDDR